jgi:uncharacterized coiled-coil DUF342 family protein
MEKDFSELVEYLDGKFNKVDEKFIKIDEKFIGIDQRFNKVDEKFVRIDEKFVGTDQKFDKISGEIINTKQEVVNIKENMVTKDDFSNLLTSVDGYAHKADGYFQEMVMLSKKVDRHETWLLQVADKLGIKLEY